jgi:hypothetical protein
MTSHFHGNFNFHDQSITLSTIQNRQFFSNEKHMSTNKKNDKENKMLYNLQRQMSFHHKLKPKAIQRSHTEVLSI